MDILGVILLNEVDVFVSRVIDGDTFVGEVQTHIMDAQIRLEEIHFRLEGINAPEKNGATKAEGEASMNFLKSLIEGKIVQVQSDRKEKYGRNLASVFFNGINVNDYLVEEGYAERRVY